MSPELVNPSMAGFEMSSSIQTPLSESNKGHQLLKKMGWSGSSGLGAKEHGILGLELYPFFIYFKHQIIYRSDFWW